MEFLFQEMQTIFSEYFNSISQLIEKENLSFFFNGKHFTDNIQIFVKYIFFLSFWYLFTIFLIKHKLLI